MNSRFNVFPLQLSPPQRFPDSTISHFPDSTISRFPDFPLSRFNDFPLSRFPDSTLPRPSHQDFRTLSSDIAIFFFRKPALYCFNNKSGEKSSPLKWCDGHAIRGATRKRDHHKKEDVMIPVNIIELLARERQTSLLREVEMDRLGNAARGAKPRFGARLFSEMGGACIAAGEWLKARSRRKTAVDMIACPTCNGKACA